MKYSRNFLKKLEEALLDTKEDPLLSFGICYNISNRSEPDMFMRVSYLLDALMYLWPKHTGTRDYPVPGGDYCSCQNDRSLWDKTTQYGRNRYELLDFLIEQVQAMIQEIDDYIEEHELEYLEDVK